MTFIASGNAQKHALLASKQLITRLCKIACSVFISQHSAEAHIYGYRFALAFGIFNKVVYTIYNALF